MTYYAVVNKTTFEPRLVEANSKAQATAHVAADLVRTYVPGKDELVALMVAGIKPEIAVAPKQEGPPGDDVTLPLPLPLLATDDVTTDTVRRAFAGLPIIDAMLVGVSDNATPPAGEH